MRADLNTMEQTDLYLQGKMSATESSLFESNMAQNPELNALVQDQQLLIQMVNRKAILAEINAVVGGGSVAWYANPYITFGGLGLIVAVVASMVYLNSEPVAENTTSVEKENVVAENTGVPVSPEDVAIMPLDSLLEEENGVGEKQKNRIDKPFANTTPEEDNGQKTLLPDDIKDNGADISDNTNNAGAKAGDLLIKKGKNKLARFPKGDLAMKEFVRNNLVYPRTAMDKEIQGNVRVKFLVDNQGRITEIESECFNLRDVNDKPLNSGQMILNQKIIKLFENKAEQFVRIMPSWEPATDSQGNPVLSPVMLYFNFSLVDGITVYQLLENTKSELIEID